MHRLMLLTALFTLGCAAAPRTPFARAIRDDDAEAVRRFLDNGEPVEQGQERGLTPLIWAARADAVRVIGVLLDAGANPNLRDPRNHWTPLMHAVHTRSARAVARLLERGADPNAVDGDQRLVPLLMAAGDASPAIVRLLLAHGANPRYEADWGDTPLGLALSGGALTDLTDRPILGGCRTENVRAIIAADPAIHLADNAASRRAYFFAKFHGCAESIRMVEDGHAPRSATGNSSSAAPTRPDGPAPPPATASRSQP